MAIMLFMDAVGAATLIQCVARGPLLSDVKFDMPWQDTSSVRCNRSVACGGVHAKIVSAQP